MRHQVGFARVSKDYDPMKHGAINSQTLYWVYKDWPVEIVETDLKTAYPLDSDYKYVRIVVEDADVPPVESPVQTGKVVSRRNQR